MKADRQEVYDAIQHARSALSLCINMLVGMESPHWMRPSEHKRRAMVAHADHAIERLTALEAKI